MRVGIGIVFGSFAFDVRLRKSVRMSLIAVSGSVHTTHIEAVPCEKASVGLG